LGLPRTGSGTIIPNPQLRVKPVQSSANSLAAVFDRHYAAMIAWCRRRVGQRLGDPEDFVHLAYILCARYWKPERASGRCETAYLYRTLRCVVVDAARNDAQRQRTTRRLPRRSAGDRHDVPHQAAATEAVGLLAGRQLQVCRALAKGKSKGEICRELAISRSALAVHMSRAKARLCELLEMDRN